MDEHCSINPARMALMQTAEREPVAVATRGFGRQARGARQGGGSRRNNGRGWNVAGATGENGKALGKIRNFENRSTEEVAMPKPTTTPVVSVVTEVLVPATNGVHKRKRDGEDKATIEVRRSQSMACPAPRAQLKPNCMRPSENQWCRISEPGVREEASQI